ncbi:MAG: AraC family transcriptional regulator [Acetivibrionales bacterium]|nr:AraC family transcriptional regulator [Clostridiaceae bacterium]
MSNKIIFNKIEKYASYYKHPSYYLERKMLNALKRGIRKEAVETLNVINKMERARLADTPIRSIKNSLIASCTLFTRAAIDANVPPEDAFSHSDVHILEIESCNNLNDLKEYEYKMFEDYFQLIEKYRQENYSPLTVKIVQYIHENITEQIKLEEISSLVNRSKAYISMFFKKEVGISLMDYINLNKAEESKYFIKYTNMSIAEIAYLFNYCNPAYFSNIFKKYLGVTPSDFRASRHGDGSFV